MNISDLNLNLLSAEECQQLDELLRSAENIVITCHNRPDGDALGSSLAWAEMLRVHYGKSPQIIIPSAYPDFLMWMPGTERLIRYDKRQEEADLLLQEADLVCCMDFNSLGRVEAMQPALAASPARLLLVDHHENPDVNATFMVSRPELSSTCELVFRLTYQLGAFDEMDKKFAVPVYCGMMTDTGGFSYSASYPEIFLSVSLLLTKGINTVKIHNNVFHNYSTWAIRLRGHLMSQKLNVLADGRASYYTLTRENMRDYKFVRGDVEGLVNTPLTIKGMKVSIQLREDDRVDNKIWVSLRSVEQFSVEEMAKRFFNGGGHLNASGGHLECSIEEAERITREAIKAYEEELKK